MYFVDGGGFVFVDAIDGGTEFVIFAEDEGIVVPIDLAGIDGLGIVEDPREEDVHGGLAIESSPTGDLPHRFDGDSLERFDSAIFEYGPLGPGLGIVLW